MLGEHGFHQALVASGVRGCERVFEDFIQLTILNLGWDVLTLKEFLGGGAFFWIVLQ